MIVALLVEIAQMGMNKNKVRDGLLNGMAEKLFPQIAEELMRKKDTITKEIHLQFSELKEKTTMAANGQIADERKHQADIVEQAGKDRYEKDRENVRQDAVLAAVYDRMSLVYRLLYDRQLDRADVDKLAAAVDGVSR